MDPVIKEQVKLLKDSVESINSIMAMLHKQNVLVQLSLERASTIDPMSIKILLINQHIDYLKEVNE